MEDTDRRAKIMATLGPASWDGETISRLLEAGLDVVRLNLSHGSHEGHRQTIRRVREIARRHGRHVPVVLDLMGPRYRLGEMTERRRLKQGTEVRLGTEGEVDVPVEEGVLEYLEPGERMLVDNGLIELSVKAREGATIVAEVVSGGCVSSRKGINLPDSKIPFEISGKDATDIRFAVAEEVDYLAASYVGSAADVEAVRREAEDAGGRLPVVAKLERAAAVDRLEEIVRSADALMVARGDLGVEVPLHQVPVLQKRIVAAGRRSGKPVVVATQMLESMIEQPRPTRAEATDVANAVFDGADALMLSGETAAGDYPVEAVTTMAQIIREAEGYQRRGGAVLPIAPRPTAPLLETGPAGEPGTGDEERDIPDVVSAAAVHATTRLSVRWIVAFSQGGFTARLIARYRPEAPVLVFTTDARVARQVQLVWGVRPFLMEAEVEHLDEVVEVVEQRLLDSRLIAPGEALIILMGDPIPERPLTNLMRLHRIPDGP